MERLLIFSSHQHDSVFKLLRICNKNRLLKTLQSIFLVSVICINPLISKAQNAMQFTAGTEIIKYNDRIHSAWGINPNLTGSFKISKRFFIETGLGYSYLYHHDRFSFDTISPVQERELLYYHNYTFKQISIPISLRYTSWQKRGFEVSEKVGFDMMFPILEEERGESYSFDANSHTLSGPFDYYKQYNNGILILGNAGIRVSKLLTTYLGLFCNLNSSISLTNDTHHSFRFFNSLGFGIQYQR